MSRTSEYLVARMAYSFVSDGDCTLYMPAYCCGRSKAVRLVLSLYSYSIMLICAYRINQCLAAMIVYSCTSYKDFTQEITVYTAVYSGRSKTVITILIYVEFFLLS